LYKEENDTKYIKYGNEDKVAKVATIVLSTNNDTICVCGQDGNNNNTANTGVPKKTGYLIVQYL